MEILMINALHAITIIIYMASNVFNAIIHGYFYFNAKFILNQVTNV